MRNPVRLKNLRLRFLPVTLVCAAALAWLEPRSWALLSGSVLVAFGLVLRTWGAGHLSKTDQLSVSGPYAHLRHPLYCGTLLICAGFGLALGPVGWLLLALTLLWFFARYFPSKERSESDSLERRFGSAYVLYRGQVPALVPRLRPWSPAAAAPLGWSGARYAANNELGTLLGVAAAVALLALRAASP